MYSCLIVVVVQNMVRDIAQFEANLKRSMQSAAMTYVSVFEYVFACFMPRCTVRVSAKTYIS